MKDKQQIKKIAQDIANNCNDLVETSCDGKPCYVCIAEKLAKQGYRKIPEDSVVIPNKITEETSPETLIKIAKYNEKIRKETAREIIQELWEDGSTFTINRLRKLASKYDIEIKEFL